MQETNLTGGVYAQESARHRVVEADVQIRHQRGDALFYRESPNFTVEAHQKNGPKVLIFQMEMGTGAGSSWGANCPRPMPQPLSELSRPWARALGAPSWW